LTEIKTSPERDSPWERISET